MKNILLFIIAFSLLLPASISRAQTDVPSDTKKKANKSTREKTSKKDKAEEAEKTMDLSSLYEAAEQVVEEKTNGSVNWTQQYVEARGESVIDTIRFKNKGQARAMAIRGAVVVAQRNLLEIINGVRVHGETTVENMIATEDIIYTRVDGLIKGAEMVGEPYEEWGMMVVIMKVPLYQNNGLAAAVYPALEKALKSSSAGLLPGEELKSGEVITELSQFAFNLGGRQFDPSMFPIVTDEEGNILLDLTRIYNPDLGQFPQILKTSKELMSEMGFEKGVEVIDVIDSFDGKLVVDKSAKKKVNWDKVASTVAKIGKILLLFV
ncbi:MAG: hypothetical protein JXA03_09575 [Bacteroidales bacterium]|nr:hypothetical protein [Bacteroidales bacterium]